MVKSKDDCIFRSIPAVSTLCRKFRWVLSSDVDEEDVEVNAIDEGGQTPMTTSLTLVHTSSGSQGDRRTR